MDAKMNKIGDRHGASIAQRGCKSQPDCEDVRRTADVSGGDQRSDGAIAVTWIRRTSRARWQEIARSATPWAGTRTPRVYPRRVRPPGIRARGLKRWRTRRDSNSRPLPSEGRRRTHRKALIRLGFFARLAIPAPRLFHAHALARRRPTRRTGISSGSVSGGILSIASINSGRTTSA